MLSYLRVSELLQVVVVDESRHILVSDELILLVRINLVLIHGCNVFENDFLRHVVLELPNLFGLHLINELLGLVLLEVVRDCDLLPELELLPRLLERLWNHLLRL